MSDATRRRCGLCGALWRPDHMNVCPVAKEAHPEDFCQECGDENVSWVVPSDRFNLAMQAIGRDRSAIVCPVCFVKAHRKATGLTATWELVPATPFRPIPGGISTEEFAQRAVKIAEAWRIGSDKTTDPDSA